MYTRVRIFIHVSKHISTLLIKRYRAFRIISKDISLDMFIFIKWESEGCVQYLTTSNDVLSHSYHYLKGMDGEKEIIQIQGPLWHGIQHVCFFIK